MKAKAVMAAAVASALAWPLVAGANSGMRSSDAQYDATTVRAEHGRFVYEQAQRTTRSEAGTFEVATPYSPNESGPATPPNERWARYDRAAIVENVPASQIAEVVTPLSPNETGSVANEQRRYHDTSLVAARSIPNPVTPVSVNESDWTRPMDERIAYREQVASIDRIHMANASAVGTTAGAMEDRTAMRADPPAEQQAGYSYGQGEPIARTNVAPVETTVTTIEPASLPPAPTNEVTVSESQPALVESHRSVAVVPRDRTRPDADPSSTQSEPFAPESGVATPPQAAVESESGAAPATTM